MAIVLSFISAVHSKLLPSFSAAFESLITLLVAWVLYKAFIYPKFFSPLRHVPGPPVPNGLGPLAGHMIQILSEEPGLVFRRWIEQYGGLLRFQCPLNQDCVLLGNSAAVQHVFMSHSYDYIKDERGKRVTAEFLGSGLITVEGDVHRRQRKMINPAFSHGHIKGMVPLMTGAAAKLAKIWTERVQQAGPDGVEFFIEQDMSKVMLDIIGLAGFGYSFDSLTSPDNELTRAYHQAFSSSKQIIEFIRLVVPFYSYIPFQHNRVRWHASRVIQKVTTEIIEENRRRLQEELKSGVKANDSDLRDKNLMSILIRNNEKTGSLEGSKLTDDELRGQTMTFLLVGHETTSGVMTWALHHLSANPKVQSRLRQELLDHIGPLQTETYSSPNVTYDKLSSLPYLAAFVKEVLRCTAPIPYIIRMATQDDEILGYHIPKDAWVFLPSEALHKLKDVWGPDAEEFKPERWMDAETAKAASTTMVTPEMNWAYQPFLSGPRNCIGSKFALIELKVVLYHLLVGLEYLPAPGFEFKKVIRASLQPDPGMKLLVKQFIPATTA